MALTEQNNISGLFKAAPCYYYCLVYLIVIFITGFMRCRLKVKISGVELPRVMLRVSITEQFLHLFCLILGTKGHRNKFSLYE